MRSLVPADAATLVLIDRRRGGRPHVLMGRRAGGHAFMPDKWVFPGGRMERTDGLVPVASPLAPEAERQTAQAPRRHRRDPARLARALAAAAVRETFEETGVLLGLPGRGRAPAGWQDFLATGHLPHLAPLSFLARAITPPGRTRRFDARFFLADAAAFTGRGEPLPGAPHDELLDCAWMPLDEADRLDLPTVTRAVLGLVGLKLAGDAGPPPLWRWRPGAGDAAAPLG